MKLFSFFSKLLAGKIRLFLIVIFLGIFLVGYILIGKFYKNSGEDVKPTHIKQFWNMTFKYVVVHFDLKGAPPMISYLQSTLKNLKDHGTTALLVEYEDMFPYHGNLVNLTARNCYKKIELEQFLVSAAQNGLEVIPLVQTFGHLEFALKLREFHHLREDPQFPDTICPSKKESREFLKEMLRQVIQFHKNIAPLKHFHIGFNEVHQIKKCELCSKNKSSKTSIIVEHIKFISDVIAELSPKTKILLWDDIFRQMKPAEFVNLRFPNMETVSLDSTVGNLDRLHPTLRRCQLMFDNQWVAAAYKGGDGPTRTIPSLEARFGNYLNWLNFVMNYDSIQKLYRFKGIIFTGFSRYSHFEPPCELLPVAMPSLFLGLILVEKYHNGIVFYRYDTIQTDEDYELNLLVFIDYFITDDWNAALMCQKSIADGCFSTFQAMTCIFEGADLYVMLTRCSEARLLYTTSLLGGHDTNLSAGINMDDTKLGYVNMVHVKNLLDKSIEAMQELIMIESQVVDAMTPYFDKYVIEEYIVLKLSKMKKRIHDLMQFLGDYYVVKDWPRRYIDSKSPLRQDEGDKELQSVSQHV